VSYTIVELSLLLLGGVQSILG
jgi:hypothetical protein